MKIEEAIEITGEYCNYSHDEWQRELDAMLDFWEVIEHSDYETLKEVLQKAIIESAKIIQRDYVIRTRDIFQPSKTVKEYIYIGEV